MADEVFFWYSGLAAQPVSAAAHFLACALTAPRNGKIFLLGGYLRPALAIHSPTKSKKLPPRGVPSTGTCSEQPLEIEKTSFSGGTFNRHFPFSAPRNKKIFLLGGYLRPALALHSPTKQKNLPPRGVPSTGTCQIQPHEIKKASCSWGRLYRHLPNTAPRNQKNFLLGGQPDWHLPNTTPRNQKNFLLGGQQRPECVTGTYLLTHFTRECCTNVI